MNFGIYTVLIIALAILVSTAIAVQFLWLRLQKSMLEFTERMARSSAELREGMSDKLAKHFLDTQERMERSLAQSRQELQGGVFKHFERVQEHLKSAELKLASLNTVGQSISELNALLKLPHLRGGFGEAALERLLADFLPTTMYELQYTVVPNSAERVDAIVRLARQVLPIDCKFPREQVLPLFDTQDPTLLEEARKALADFIKTQAKYIATKYIHPEHGTTDMALLFLPSETLYFEVIRNTKLFEDISKLKVYPVSPNTLAISLHSIAIAQEYYDMARGVEKTISDIKKARSHFEHFGNKFEEVGRGIKKSQEAFETANTHLNRYESSVMRLTGERETENSKPNNSETALTAQQ
jgi:DNA recombination protein RmuC